jgi:hypothetical protein
VDTGFSARQTQGVCAEIMAIAIQPQVIALWAYGGRLHHSTERHLLFRQLVVLSTVIVDVALFIGRVSVLKYRNLAKSLILAGSRPIRPRFPPSEHNPEKWGTGFPKKIMLTQKVRAG